MEEISFSTTPRPTLTPLLNATAPQDPLDRPAGEAEGESMDYLVPSVWMAATVSPVRWEWRDLLVLWALRDRMANREMERPSTPWS